MLLRLLKNWKTTSAGLLIIIGAIVHIVFVLRSPEPVTETEIMVAVGAILGGLGMLYSTDSSESKKISDAVDKINQEGPSPDTEFLTKPPAVKDK